MAARPNLSGLYLSLIAGEWALVYYVWKVGLRRTGTTIGELIGGKWASPKAALLDVLWAGGLWTLWKGAYFVWWTWFGTGHSTSISRLMPQGATESTLWVLLSISAGISEELVFRGYFQRQFLAWTGRVSVAVLLQVMLFGIAHGYQGVQNCLAIAAYGALFTLLALYRKSLRPGILAHAWTDIAGGLLR
ncbi:CPBP family intramembrane glutamic endopeptidase [Paludibaculum fermentans]|uniref:CPBP family intramembrane metalloprotease n=1 Tax=Paludibaculum fermentans TaxID=1473598 RepID=A0A7S7NP71_PALFE|nr:type II CAAX endopeptidase family protein [Paludibaculum fermentans]QOY87215.1 CPBP family intramembrane metalloprotease [Paludibaculum fermentans]